MLPIAIGLTAAALQIFYLDYKLDKTLKNQFQKFDTLENKLDLVSKKVNELEKRLEVLNLKK